MLGKYDEEDGKRLLKLARASIEQEFTGKESEKLEDKQFRQARGVFVTLNSKGKLRGCMGFPEAVFSVSEAVSNSAKKAAFSDTRFKKLGKEELAEIKIEVSILTPGVECNANDVKVGEDGLVCSYVGYSGLLLPQVALENNFNRIEFLEAVCQKAGLPKDSWQKPGFLLKKFQCQIFSD